MGSKLTWFVAGAVTALTAAAIGQELAKPRDKRAWKGRVAGVPYSFRLSEWPDVANEYWNPDSDRIVTPHVIGLGWGVNFAAVARIINRVRGGADTAPRRARPAEPGEPGSTGPGVSTETVSPPGKVTTPGE